MNFCQFITVFVINVSQISNQFQKMKSRSKPQQRVPNSQPDQPHTRPQHSVLSDTRNINSMSISNASNNELRQVIQKLIVKSRSLIISLQKTLKQLQQVREEKDFWKNHYLAFKGSCEKYIQSRGIAPFEYINQLEKTLRDCSFRKQEALLQSSYRSMSVNNIKNFSLMNSRINDSLKTNLQSKNNLIEQVNKDISHLQSSTKVPHQQATNAKTIYTYLDQTFPIDQSHLNQTAEKSFTGIKLGGKNKISPIKMNIYDTKAKVNSSYRRKDSLETKRVELFAYSNHRNHENPKPLQSNKS